MAQDSPKSGFLNFFKQRSKDIDAMLAKDKQETADVVKLLLLGGPESPKGRVMRELELLFGRRCSEEERKKRRGSVFKKIIETFQELARHSQHLLEQKESELDFSEETVERLCFVELLDARSGFDEEIVQQLKTLWDDPEVKQAANKYHDPSLAYYIEYFVSEFDRIGDPAYIPTDTDLVYGLQKSVGIEEVEIYLDTHDFVIVDPIQYISEEKKWLHLFEDVLGILFVAFLSNYSKSSERPNSSKENVLKETIQDFAEYANSRWFQKKPFVLLLVSDDNFSSSLSSTAVSDIFKDFSGRNDKESDVVKYFKDKFEENVQKSDRQIFQISSKITDMGDVGSVLLELRQVVI